MADLLPVINQQRRLIQSVAEGGMKKHPFENGFTVYLFFQELYITAVQDIIVDASDNLLLIDNIGWPSSLAIDRIEPLVLCNVDFEILLDVSPRRGRVEQRQQLGYNPVIP